MLALAAALVLQPASAAEWQLFDLAASPWCRLFPWRCPAPKQPNPPVWPASVQVFSPLNDTATIQAAVNEAYTQNGGEDPGDHGQFSTDRYAFLFMPGTYNVEVPVGYYTQVLGLGETPDATVFTSARGVYCEESDYLGTVGSLDTFWRSAENFESQASFGWFPGMSGMLWSVSQASPLRRVIVQQDLALFQVVSDMAGYASGGFLGNSQVGGKVMSGSQQQWFTRGCNVADWDGGVWNMVFVGTEGAPDSHCGRYFDPVSGNLSLPYVTVDSAPLIAEKPFISVDGSGLYYLNVPAVRTNARGPDWSVGTQIPFEKVYVATAEDTARTINERLQQGLHVVLSPGVYNLEDSLKVGFHGHDNQVVLGLGMPSLVAMTGKPAIQVGPAAGVRLAGLLLEAGAEKSPALLQWGSKGDTGDAQNPGIIHDVFMRVGGPATPSQHQAEVMLQINADNVIGDNLWLWRADHSVQGETYNGDFPVQVGMVVNGNDVKMYGLAVEHALTDQVQWNGERGQTYFFQSELPYDVPLEYGDKGYCGYRVAPSVTEHNAYGVGVYHFFRDAKVVVPTGIVAPAALEGNFVSPLAVFLNGNGTILHILNNLGNETSNASRTMGNMVEWLCDNVKSMPDRAERVDVTSITV